jgi:chromosome partitioning protein
MPKIVCFTAKKGGIGKSTLAMLTGEMLYKLGYKVSIVDTDPQGTATKWEQRGLPNKPPFPIKVDHAVGMAALEFAEWLKRHTKDADYVIIDTVQASGSGEELSVALSVSDLAIIPVEAHISSVYTLEELSVIIGQANRQRPSPLNCVVVINKYGGRRASERSLVEAIATSSPWPVAKTLVQNLAPFSDACNYRTGLYSLPNSGVARENLSTLIKEIFDAPKE